LNKKK
jgi:hypothetical protein